MMNREYCTFLAASRIETLHLGMTNRIERSMRERKSEFEGFASKER